MTSSVPTAAELDAADPLAAFRHRFELPEGIYLVGNSLGAMPRAARDHVAAELDRWGTTGVVPGTPASTRHHAPINAQLAAIVGAQPNEVVAMNALTVNLHLMLMSFYRPSPTRHKILIEAHAFPSDHFAVESQIRQRGFDPLTSLVLVEPRPGEELLHRDDVLAAIAEHGDELALVLLPGVQYYTGQVLPMADIVAAGHAVGACVGFDLAHAVGNIELGLHDWDVDFAVWCTYKYLNSGPGGVGGAYVHQRHVVDETLPKLLGWWGANVSSRVEVVTEADPARSAESWQVSTLPVLPAAALRASLDIFDEAGGVPALRAKSRLQIEYFDRRLAETLGDRVVVITPSALAERGCQFALRIAAGDGRRVLTELEHARVFCDWREPDVIRAAPVPLYNSFDDIDRFVQILDSVCR
ncbi:MAG TPA: kynureninase [Ilumatobacter sp.]